MARVIPRLGIIKSYATQDPCMIVLHDTAGPSVKSAEQTFLNERPSLGYHFMIAKDGTIFQYAALNKEVWHARGFNTNTIGISYAGGGGFGPVTEDQIKASIGLINEVVKPKCPKLTAITGHKHCSPGRKHDPQFDGESALKADLVIDKNYMDRIAKETGLKFLNLDTVNSYLKG